MSYETVMKSLHNHTPVSVYLITGDQAYLVNRLKNTFTGLIPEEERTMNFASYDMESTPIAQALDDAMSAPFFGDRRLVFVDHAYFLTTDPHKGIKVDHDMDSLLTYLKHPEPTTVIVFLATTGKLDSRKKVVKTLKKVAEVVSLEAIGEHQIKQLVETDLQNNGFQMQPEAFSKLLQRTGSDLSLIMNELPKLKMASYDSKQIGVDVVQELVTKSLDQNVFDLVNDVMSKQIDAALSLYRQLILTKEEPLRINAVLVSQFRLLIQTKILVKNGYSQGSIASTLKVHPYRVKLAMQSTRRLKLDDLKRAYLGLIDIEKSLKSSTKDPETLFELFMLKFLNEVA
ncbi:DNA polymerase III subunit delta [Secundilactobacillus collinoides]|uniref:DNA polymerase III subunit delta n=2 Tax=Secundilactobacillus collinoides TaxID=33960 RepID=A0A0R2BDW6_SECCO|nr:DNA polymerase III subunit delta [Secundilactobacillus collinoides]KRM74076.1 DNA polymerase III subunit delta [Secundilactobacillus collinoides DSM 20515 = JCM 1123]KZL39043.1 DNA polymerase III subunit delta [Secundilactobacillus collinoides]